MQNNKTFTFSVFITSDPVYQGDSLWTITGKDTNNNTYEIDYSTDDKGIADYIRVTKTGVDNE